MSDPLPEGPDWFARTRALLEQAISEIADGTSDAVLGAISAAECSYRIGLGEIPPDELDGYAFPGEPEVGPPCICPPDLLARGGFKGSCPAEHVYDPVPETPLGSALEKIPPGSSCSTVTVLECPHCRVAYADDVPLGHDLGFCGPCQHIAKHTGEFTCQRFRRRARLPHDRLSLSYRW